MEVIMAHRRCTRANAERPLQKDGRADRWYSLLRSFLMSFAVLLHRTNGKPVCCGSLAFDFLYASRSLNISSKSLSAAVLLQICLTNRQVFMIQLWLISCVAFADINERIHPWWTGQRPRTKHQVMVELLALPGWHWVSKIARNR